MSMAGQAGREYVETLVIGGGQAGLATGYQLSQRDLPYKIIDANKRIGDAWRNRWDSLRLFTPNRLNRLPGMRFSRIPLGVPKQERDGPTTSSRTLGSSTFRWRPESEWRG